MGDVGDVVLCEAVSLVGGLVLFSISWLVLFSILFAPIHFGVLFSILFAITHVEILVCPSHKSTTAIQIEQLSKCFTNELQIPGIRSDHFPFMLVASCSKCGFGYAPN